MHETLSQPAGIAQSSFMESADRGLIVNRLTGIQQSKVELDVIFDQFSPAISGRTRGIHRLPVECQQF